MMSYHRHRSSDFTNTYSRHLYEPSFGKTSLNCLYDAEKYDSSGLSNYGSSSFYGKATRYQRSSSPLYDRDCIVSSSVTPEYRSLRLLKSNYDYLPHHSRYSSSHLYDVPKSKQKERSYHVYEWEEKLKSPPIETRKYKPYSTSNYDISTYATTATVDQTSRVPDYSRARDIETTSTVKANYDISTYATTATVDQTSRVPDYSRARDIETTSTVKGYETPTTFSTDLYTDSNENEYNIDESFFKGDGTNGLKNLGNTCFMNSILQCLSNTTKLRDYAIQGKHVVHLNSKSNLKGKLFKAFADVIRNLWSGNGTFVDPSKLKSKIEKVSSRFAGYEQHDSQEFLRFLLNGLHEETNQASKHKSEPIDNPSQTSDPVKKAKESWKLLETGDKSFIFDLFVGQLQSSLECMECGHISLTYDPFWDLSLPLFKPAQTLAETNSSLNECLEGFTKEELLEKDNAPFCERCEKHQKMKKTLLIHRFPEILVIHLKRFREGRLYKQKLSSLIKFPVKETLDLGSFATRTCANERSSTFQLYAVSNHSGTSFAGHYTAYCKNPKTKSWHEFNDRRVSLISEESVCTRNAYVLFYVQKKDVGEK